MALSLNKLTAKQVTSIKEPGHHAALPYKHVPTFIADLREREATATRALEFTILTPARSGETRGMKWREVDRVAGVWTVQPERMKAFNEHRVPLMPRALAVLDERTNFGTDADAYVFPGQQKKDRPLSDMAMDMVLRRMKIDVTVHGFRSSFRDWCGEESTFPREIAEATLAHVLGDETERSLSSRRRAGETPPAHDGVGKLLRA